MNELFSSLLKGTSTPRRSYFNENRGVNKNQFTGNRGMNTNAIISAINPAQKAKGMDYSFSSSPFMSKNDPWASFVKPTPKTSSTPTTVARPKTATASTPTPTAKTDSTQVGNQAGGQGSTVESGGLSDLLKSVLGFGGGGAEGKKVMGWYKASDGTMVPYYDKSGMAEANREAKTRTEYTKMEEDRLAPIKQAEETELAENAKNAARRQAALQQSLAKRGVIDTTGSTGTQGDEALAEASKDEERITQSIRNAYAIQRSELSADVKEKMLAQLTADRQAAEEAAQNKIDTYLASAGLGKEIYGQIYAQEKDKLDRALAEKQITQEAYDAEQGRLIDWYNARTTRMNAETSAGKASGTGTGTGNTELKTNALKAAQDVLSKFQQGIGTSAVGGNTLNRLGFIGDWLDKGTGRADFRASYDNLKSLLSLENIKYLKGQGAVSDAERALLEKASTKLSRNLSEEEFLSVLQDVVSVLSEGAGGEDDPLGLLGN